MHYKLQTQMKSANVKHFRMASFFTVKSKLAGKEEKVLNFFLEVRSNSSLKIIEYNNFIFLVAAVFKLQAMEGISDRVNSLILKKEEVTHLE